jgi:protoporphyrinogen oxidase
VSLSLCDRFLFKTETQLTFLRTGLHKVIVGGGMSGISAAAQLIEDQIADLSVVILESTNRLGGRVKSKKDFGKGGPDGKTNGWTIEEGANWQISYEDNEVFALLQEYEMKFTHTNFVDFNKSSYQYHDYLPVRSLLCDL